MTEMVFETRRVSREDLNNRLPVVIRRDRRNMSYEGAARLLFAEGVGLNRLFELVGEVADTSEGGIRVSFRGQSIRALNLFKRSEVYWLKLSLGGCEARAPRWLVRGGDSPFLLLRAICCWHRSGVDGDLSAAGFELEGFNHPDVVAFVQSGFGARPRKRFRSADPANTDWLQEWAR